VGRLHDDAGRAFRRSLRRHHPPQKDGAGSQQPAGSRSIIIELFARNAGRQRTIIAGNRLGHVPVRLRTVLGSFFGASSVFNKFGSFVLGSFWRISGSFLTATLCFQ